MFAVGSAALAGLPDWGAERHFDAQALGREETQIDKITLLKPLNC